MLPGGPRCTRPLATRVCRLRLSGPRASAGSSSLTCLLAEVLADDGGPGKDAAGTRPKALQARRQQGLNRRRQLQPDVAAALLAEGDRQLLQVEGIAASGVDEPGPGGRGNALTRGYRVEQRCGRALAERRELDGRPPCPSRPPRRGAGRAAPGGRCRPAVSASYPAEGRAIPPGRGRSVRPSAGPRTRQAPAGAARAFPGSGGRPRRSRRRPSCPGCRGRERGAADRRRPPRPPPRPAGP